MGNKHVKTGLACTVSTSTALPFLTLRRALFLEEGKEAGLCRSLAEPVDADSALLSLLSCCVASPWSREFRQHLGVDVPDTLLSLHPANTPLVVIPKATGARLWLVEVTHLT